MDLSSKIAEVLDKHEVSAKHGGKLIGELMKVAMDYHEYMTPKPIGTEEVTRRIQAFENGEDPLNPNTGKREDHPHA